jgi:anti-anti-sigma factor
MEIQEDRKDGILVVAPAGRIDSSTCGELEGRLLQHLAAGETRLIIDLQGVEYISSAGLRVLLLVTNRLRPLDGRLVLCAMSRSVCEVFELAGFTTLFAIEGSRESAVARLAGPA